MFKITAYIIGLLFTQIVLANDTTASVAAGGIQYKKSDTISMDEEILKISIDKIDISYRFFNHTDKDIEETVAFPLPLSPLPYAAPTWDEAYIARSLLRPDNTINLKQFSRGSAFIDFERSVNGNPYRSNYHLEAIHTTSKKNITALLRQHNIPLSAAYLSGYMEEGALSRDSVLKAKLKTMQLLDSQDKPLWKTQTTYVWTQIFPAKTSVLTTHRYTPHMFCWNGEIEKNKDGALISTLENFTPTKDLKILFVRI